MAYKKKTNTTKRPSHDIFHAIPNKAEEGKSFWTKIGAAWENSDGSLNLKFNYLPTDLDNKDNTIQIRKVEEK